MSTPRIAQLAPTIFLSALAACASAKRIDEGPITIMSNGDRVDAPVRATDAATTRALESRIAGRDQRDSIVAVAYAACAPATCEALGRGELALGMTEAEVYAATRSLGSAWTQRRSGRVLVLSPRDADALAADAVAPVALVQLSDGAVASMTYREPQGLRTVTRTSDVNDAGRVRAAALVREGDALALAGDFTGALERYDRASVVSAITPEVQYKIATSLDKLLRPIEAQMRYRLFLHQLELEKIGAIGDANAKMAAAMVQARERLIVLERSGR